MYDKNVPRGFGPYKEVWYSYCSRHSLYNEDCKLCNKGQWVNVWNQKLSELIYEYFPSIWKKLFSYK